MYDTPDTTKAQKANGLGMIEHEERASVLGELHARPLLSVKMPRRVYHFAFLTNEEEAQADRANINALAEARGAAPPAPRSKFHQCDFGAWDLRWEQHTEFTTYTWSTGNDAEEPFTRNNPIAEGDVAFKAPGRLIVAVNLSIVSRTKLISSVGEFFSPESLCVVEASDGQARVSTDFLVDPNGFTRFLIESRGMTERRAGRLMQRVLEIETYRTLALLGLPVARKVGPVLGRMEHELSDITGEISKSQDHHKSHALLMRLGGLTAELEAQSAATAFRFGATRAYYDLVRSRLELIHETPTGDNVSITAFFNRRLVPAIETCNAVEARQGRLTGQLARAADLLRTGIQFDLEQQNRGLLRSMNRRAKLQLRLQQTVEGLSVAAISYYVIGLVGYIAKGLSELGGAFSLIKPGLVTAVAVPIVIAGVWYLTQRVRHNFSKTEDEDGDA